eukprot:4329738-Alexandrium_andersonii.AAC.1
MGVEAIGDDLVEGAAPAERLRFGRGPTASSPGGTSNPPLDIADMKGTENGDTATDQWRVPPLRCHEGTRVQMRVAVPLFPLSRIRARSRRMWMHAPTCLLYTSPSPRD